MCTICKKPNHKDDIIREAIYVTEYKRTPGITYTYKDEIHSKSEKIRICQDCIENKIKEMENSQVFFKKFLIGWFIFWIGIAFVLQAFTPPGPMKKEVVLFNIALAILFPIIYLISELYRKIFPEDPETRKKKLTKRAIQNIVKSYQTKKEDAYRSKNA